MSVARTPAVLGRRGCALIAVGSATLHGLMVGHAGSVALAVLVLGMVAACLFCAYELWTSGSLRAWCIVAVMNLGMVAVHWSAPGHHHGVAVPTAAAMPASTLMTVATTLSVVEAAVATAVLLVRSRGRAVSLGVG